MVVAAIAAVQAASEKNVPPAEVVASETEVAPPTADGLLNASCDCTVVAAEQAPALTVCAAVTKASRVGLAGLIVSVCVAAASAPPDTVSVGAPARVSRK